MYKQQKPVPGLSTTTRTQVLSNAMIGYAGVVEAFVLLVEHSMGEDAALLRVPCLTLVHHFDVISLRCFTIPHNRSERSQSKRGMNYTVSVA